MKIMCKIFGHRYVYSILPDSPLRNLRVCTRCGIIEEYRDMTTSIKGWFQLVSRTKMGAMKLLGKIQRGEL